MAKGRRGYGMDEVLAAIEGSKGIVSYVAKKLDCDWNTARKYIDKWETTKAAFAAEREVVLDMAEMVLVKKLTEEDEGTAKWLLNYLGRHRGYGKAIDITTGGEPLPAPTERIIVREVIRETDTGERGDGNG